mmetsp:Transcript_101924/g.297228  ORF Transcript_101924/g.297228 Transcript_101924/m.297228 type:complete len:215 (+) Transcript_101924:863-1507(+)
MARGGPSAAVHPLRRRSRPDPHAYGGPDPSADGGSDAASDGSPNPSAVDAGLGLCPRAGACVQWLRAQRGGCGRRPPHLRALHPDGGREPDERRPSWGPGMGRSWQLPRAAPVPWPQQWGPPLVLAGKWRVPCGGGRGARGAPERWLAPRGGQLGRADDAPLRGRSAAAHGRLLWGLECRRQEQLLRLCRRAGPLARDVQRQPPQGENLQPRPH